MCTILRTELIFVLGVSCRYSFYSKTSVVTIRVPTVIDPYTETGTGKWRTGTKRAHILLRDNKSKEFPKVDIVRCQDT